jgi:alpha/beta hydrolase fold
VKTTERRSASDLRTRLAGQAGDPTLGMILPGGWMRRILIALCALVALAVGTGTIYQSVATRQDLAATPPPGRLVNVGGHRLHIWCVGSGTPAVILETGLGSTSADWGFVQPEVARFTTACAYDRAGMGYSDPGPSPRTARRIANELAQLLQRSGLTAPVILVGASIGGLSARLFASEHTDRSGTRRCDT